MSEVHCYWKFLSQIKVFQRHGSDDLFKVIVYYVVC